MAYRFPKTISAARIATFVSTAAWIQGIHASEVELPEEPLENFLRRHGIASVSARQVPVPIGEKEEVEEEEEEDGPESSENGEEEDDENSSVDSPGSTPSDSMDDEDETPSIPDPPQAGIAAGASGQPAIGSPDAPTLSTGARVAIGVWSAVAVCVIAGLIFFICRRRRRAKLAQQEINDLRDEELARSEPTMSEVGMPEPAVIEPVHLRGPGSGAGTVRAPSGQWMPTPPWQEDPPTWRDSHPWRQSQPSVVAAPNGLPSNVRPPFPKPEYDRRTEDAESTIFAYR
ncbi:hypothetical protein GGS26DRAFT_254180 [Hypomontagnella submonticulosa]|nr:hypothetical protein GGS26DRAFT_254180 [Hypomontagnella submonticulosa]